MKLTLKPISIKAAKAFVKEHHRHGARMGITGLFATSITDGSQTVGVAIAGLPVARMLRDDFTCEIVRCCVLEGHSNGCSMLYGALRRAARALGFTKVITYTRVTEDGASLRAAGFRIEAQSQTGSAAIWSRAARPRQPNDPVQKHRWES